MDTSSTRILRPNRFKTFGWLALCAGFTAGGAWMIFSGEPMGWLPALFFGLCVVVFVVTLLPNSAYLRVSQDGFTVCSLFRAQSYRWSDVGPFTVGRIGPNRMVVFNFSGRYRAQPRARKAAAALTGYEGALPDSYGMSLEELASLLNGYRQPKPIPESFFVVEVSDAGVSCARPGQKVEKVAWDDLQRVEIVNTDEGPFLPDVFWVLHGSESGCVIPQGAAGEEQLLERLQKLPGFDNKAVIEAMTVTTNKRSLCWQRPAAGA
jgi:hypothetical protein